ncbi:DUF3226 domain-containing protein [Maridesulfovibrio frigidus]|uniref:DUF3226 domain-containing protein n=1 Tax=Maridesulfovibrio frigidus TaxID=340956 RepID=UPI0004E24847|nr:DUF3226 domain-containing protein [Maridesulfovibrio frigidus]
MKYGYLAVEGPHDLAFVGKILKFYDFTLVKQIADIEGTPFEDLIPTSFPHEGDLLKRMPVPAFFRKADEMIIAISCANSDTRLVEDIQEALAVLVAQDLDGVGIIADLDSEKTPVNRFNAFADGIEKLKLVRPAEAGKASSGSPNTGVYILPDNSSEGTLEDLLIPCAEKVYPTLMQSACSLIDSLDIACDEFKRRDKKEILKPAGKKKAKINIVGSVLKPGKSIQVSIQDNRWISEETRTLPQIIAFENFIKELFSL